MDADRSQIKKAFHFAALAAWILLQDKLHLRVGLILLLQGFYK